MTPINIFDYVASDTLVLDVAVVDKKTGRSMSLVGASVTWTLRPVRIGWVGDAVVTLENSGVSPGIVFIDAAKGRLRVTLAKDVLTIPGNYTNALEIELSSGDRETVGGGPFVCLAVPVS